MAKQTQGNKAPTAPAPAAAPTTATPAPAPAVAVAVRNPLPTVAAALVPTAPPKGTNARKAAGTPFVNPMPKSTVSNPVQVAWQLYAALYQQHGPALTRTQACNAAMAAGVAYYTARTQYQLWRTVLLQSAHTAQGAQAAGA